MPKRAVPKTNIPPGRWLVTVEMPAEAAQKLLKGFQEKDPKLMAAMQEAGFNILDIQPLSDTQVDIRIEVDDE